MKAALRLIRAIAAAVAILGIVVGAPVALAVVATDVLPPRWLAWDELIELLARPDDGTLLLGVLLVIGTAAWLQLTFSIAVELVGAVARRPAIRIGLPGFWLSRSIAALLVGSLLGTGSATASAAPLAFAAVAAPMTPGPSTDSRHGPPPQPEPPMYEVAERDTLWRIAERELGDPLRWREIFELNAGRVQADGGRLTEAGLLHVGWRLVLPDDAELEPSGAERRITVHPGDTLSEIAQAELGDGSRAAEIFELNRDHVQPDGGRLVKPDLVRPGWNLLLPEAQDEVPHAQHAPRTTSPPQPTTQPPSTTHPPAAPNASSMPSPAPLSPPAAPATDPAGDRTADAADRDVTLPLVLGTSVLVIGGLVAALAARRRRQLHARRPHHRIAVPDDRHGRIEWLAEQAVAVPAQLVIDTAFLDAALRGLALSNWTGIDAPPLRTVVLANDHLLVDLGARASLPPPFEPIGDADEWRLPASAQLPLPSGEASGYCAPFPALVSIGSADDGRTLFVDLEELGVVHVIGEPDRAVGLLRHIAAELANSRWSEDTEVLLAGFGQELVPLNPERLRVVTDLGTALAEVRSRIRAAHDTLARLDLRSVVEGRLRPVAPDAWVPIVLLATGPATDTDRDELADLAETIGGSSRRPAAVITTGVTPAGAEIHVGDDGQLAMPRIGSTWIAASMSVATGADLAAILAPTLEPDVPTHPATEPEPWATAMAEDGTLVIRQLEDETPPLPPKPASAEPPERDPEALRRLGIVEQQDPQLDEDLGRWQIEGTPPVPLIGILGEPIVRAPGDLPSRRPSWFTEILVYLSLHPLGVTMDKALTDLWPEGQKITPATVRHAFYGARRWAGRGLDGDPERPFVSDMQSDGTYRMRGHLLDWDLFRRLRKRAQARHGAHHPGATDDYVAALRLIRGPVLTPLRPGGYAWLNNHDQRHDLQIPGFLVDAAHELVDIALRTGDTTLARWAAETARTVDIDVVFDRPLTDLMRVAHAENRPSEMERYAAVLLDARGFDVPEELPPETFAVLNDLLPDGPRRRRA